MIKHNPQKGEVPVTVATHELVFVATMGNLAALAGQTGTQSQNALLTSLISKEPRAMIAAVECLSREKGGEAAHAFSALVGKAGLDAAEEIAAAATRAILFDPEPEPGEG